MSNISRERIIETAANLSNKAGLENLSLKMIAEELKIKSPSLYNHVSSLDDIKKQLMLYGWKQIETLTIEAAVGVTGYEALKNMCYAFYKNATRKLFEMIFKVMKTVNISDENINHIIRTLRSFLEGFSLLVNNNAFGNPVSIKESFDLSLEIIINGIKTLEGTE